MTDYLCLAGDSVDDIHDHLMSAILAAKAEDRITYVTDATGTEMAAIVPSSRATTAELLTVPAVAAAEDARDKVVATLRHRLCELVFHASSSQVPEIRHAEARATATALALVIDSLGSPGDRTLARPGGAMELCEGAEQAARDWLGPATALHLFGRCQVL